MSRDEWMVGDEVTIEDHVHDHSGRYVATPSQMAGDYTITVAPMPVVAIGDGAGEDSK